MKSTLMRNSTGHERGDIATEQAGTGATEQGGTVATEQRMQARIVDHACSGSASISAQIAAMRRTANVDVVAELCADQPSNACGYTAAEVAVNLRSDAMAFGKQWLSTKLPEYSHDACVVRLNKELKNSDEAHARILESDEVNALVRDYAGLAQVIHPEEDWYGGAVALDHFFQGLEGRGLTLCSSLLSSVILMMIMMMVMVMLIIMTR